MQDRSVAASYIEPLVVFVAIAELGKVQPQDWGRGAINRTLETGTFLSYIM